MSWEAPVRLRVSVVVAALVLAGCNANQDVNLSSRRAPEVFAGHYDNNNPYNPISYAQNNTAVGVAIEAALAKLDPATPRERA